MCGGGVIASVGEGTLPFLPKERGPPGRPGHDRGLLVFFLDSQWQGRGAGGQTECKPMSKADPPNPSVRPSTCTGPGLLNVLRGPRPVCSLRMPRDQGCC